MPYVQGETLADRLDREGQLPVDQAVGIASAVAQALDYAHRQGVVHRDIKPANILLQDGQPVVADFGLALAVTTAGGGRLTETGLSLGTPYYMSPEQATADRDPDARSDIYSLGCVLYEMLVGEPPHTGPSAQVILAKILTVEASRLTDHRKSIPANVESVVLRALEKLPADRFVTAGEFAAGLASPDFRHDRQDLEPAVGPHRASGRSWMLALGTAVIGLVAGLVLSPEEPAPVAPPSARFEVQVPGGLAMSGGEESPIAVSPDGSRLAYLTPEGIWIRPIDSFEARLLLNTRDATTLMFSPDGSRIAFVQTSVLRWVPVEGGPAVMVADIGSGGGMGSKWLTNGGFLLAGVGWNGIRWVAEDGGDLTQITHVLAEEGENIHAWPTDLPGTDAILYTALGTGGGWADGTTILFDPQTGTRKELIPRGTRAQYSPTGHILYVDESGTVFARPFDLASRDWTGSAEPVVSGVRTAAWGGGAAYHVSDTGVLVWIGGSELANNRLVTLDRLGTVVEDFGAMPTFTPRISPDGLQLLIDVPTGNNIDMWILTLATGERRKFTSDINEEETAIWSPDGARIMWGSAQPGGGRRVYVQPADLSTDRELVLEHPYHLHVTDWSEDGRYVTFYDFHETEGSNVYLVDLEDSGRIIPIATTGFNEQEATFSPDGRWLTYSSDETGRMEVWAVSVPDGGQKRQLTFGGGYWPRWNRQQTELYYSDKSWYSSEAATLMVRQVQPGAGLDLGPEVELFTLPRRAAFQPSLDGQRFHTLLPRPESRAYTIRVLLNWTAELEGQ